MKFRTRKTPKLATKNPRNATTDSTPRPSTPITRLANEESEEAAASARSARNGQGQGSSGSGGIPKQADTWTNDTVTGETGTMNVNVPPRMTRSSTAAKRRATDEGVRIFRLSFREKIFSYHSKEKCFSKV